MKITLSEIAELTTRETREMLYSEALHKFNCDDVCADKEKSMDELLDFLFIVEDQDGLLPQCHHHSAFLLLNNYNS